MFVNLCLDGIQIQALKQQSIQRTAMSGSAYAVARIFGYIVMGMCPVPIANWCHRMCVAGSWKR